MIDLTGTMRTKAANLEAHDAPDLVLVRQSFFLFCLSVFVFRRRLFIGANLLHHNGRKMVTLPPIIRRSACK